MYREITIGNTTVPMLANAATALRFKHVFKKDLLKELQGAEADTGGVASEILPGLAFIMAKAAEAKEGKANMDLLDEKAFVNWLERFEPLDIPNASEAIVNLYIGNAEPSLEAKKKEKDGVNEK